MPGLPGSICTRATGTVSSSCPGTGSGTALDISADYSKPGANNDGYNAIGYGYQWWVPEGDQGEFMAIGVYGQFLYVNPEQNVIIVKVNADPDFMAEHYELKHVEFFRAIADGLR